MKKQRANDNIPEDEMMLAEAIRSARLRGLGFTDGGMLALGYDFHNDTRKPADRCCAYGALAVAGLVPRCFSNAPDKLSNIADGNDEPSRWGSDSTDQGESLGWAFRCAMTQEEP